MKLRCLVFLSALQMVAYCQPKTGDHWVTTWATAESLIRTPPPAPAQPPTTPPKANPATRGFDNQTVRMAVRISMGGKRLRVRLSNSFGSAPLAIGAVHIAQRSKDSEIVAGSDHALTFDGKPGCVIGPGIVLASDAVDMTVASMADLSISIFFPGETGPPTTHGTGLHNAYVAAGDQTNAPSFSGPVSGTQYFYVSGIDVLAPADAATVVTLGDSITDGARSTNETDHSWPILLAARLAGNKATAGIGVANEGIGGNRILRDVSGTSALARFDRDVLSQPGVKWVMFLEGINDIGHGTQAPAEAVTAEELIAGHKQIIEMAHAHGIQAIGCTLTPFEGAAYFSEHGQEMREALNKWIRTSGAYDAVVDFDAAVHDTADIKKFRADFDPGDHLHPNNAGYEAMANSIDLAIFTGKIAKKPATKK
jgi:lysophospholipase L1-like esterase